MRRFMILSVTVVAMIAFANWSQPVNASDFGIHFAGPGYHVDLGRTHHRRHYRSYPSRSYHGHGGGYHGGGHVWHDTSHYDYHPGEFVRHRNHYHYVPGHYDYHETGHWDHYGW